MSSIEARTDRPVAEKLLGRFAAWPAFAKVLADLRGGVGFAHLRGLDRIDAVSGRRCFRRRARRSDRSGHGRKCTSGGLREEIDFLLGPAPPSFSPTSGARRLRSAAGAKSDALAPRKVLCALALGPTAGLPTPNPACRRYDSAAWTRRVPDPAWLRRKIRVLRVGERVDPDE
jgi:hypothetical protein